MLFSRRNPAGWREKIRVMLWPRRSLRRSVKYFTKRILRLRATPHAVAVGVAAGIFVSFLPIPGFHFIVAAVAAWLVAGNVVASALGTAFGNPLTFPAIWGATYEVGHLILVGRDPGSVHMPNMFHMFRSMELSQLWDPLLKPMTVGAIPLGLVFATVFYVVTRWAVTAFHDRRRLRFAEKAAGRLPPAAVNPS